jgi:hypothetical protein
MMPDMPEPKHARLSKLRELTAQPRVILGAVIIAGCLGLTVPAFAVLFLTVTHLLRPWFGHWAWTVPICTETGYVVVYLADLLMEMCDRPVRWLRYVPLPFVASSLWLNVYAADGHLAAMVGHGVVTVTFFGTLAVAKMAARRLIRAKSERIRREGIPLARWIASPVPSLLMHRRMVLRNIASYAVAVELEDARRFARDITKAHFDGGWRSQAPRVLKARIRDGRLGDEVTRAATLSVAAGVTGGWEDAARSMVTKAVLEGDKLTAAVRREQREMTGTTGRTKPARKPGQRTGQKRGTSGRTTAGTSQAAKRAIVQTLLQDNSDRTNEDIAAEAGVSVKTVSRYRNAPPLHAVSGTS